MEAFKEFLQKVTFLEWAIIAAIAFFTLLIFIFDDSVNDRLATRSADSDRTTGVVTCYSGGEIVYSKRATGITSVYRNEFNFFDSSETLVTASITMCMIERGARQQ